MDHVSNLFWLIHAVIRQGSPLVLYILDTPQVDNLVYGFEDSAIIATWDYSSPAMLRPAENSDVHVGLQFIYTVEGSDVSQYHPAENQTVDANDQITTIVVIEGEVYNIVVVIFEGGNKIGLAIDDNYTARRL